MTRHPMTYVMWVLSTLFVAMMAYAHQFGAVAVLIALNLGAFLLQRVRSRI